MNFIFPKKKILTVSFYYKPHFTDEKTGFEKLEHIVRADISI